MADLKSVRSKKLAIGAKVNSQPMPPTRLPAPIHKPTENQMVTAPEVVMPPISSDSVPGAASTPEPVVEPKQPPVEAPEKVAPVVPYTASEQAPAVQPALPQREITDPPANKVPEQVSRSATTKKKTVGQGATATRFTLTLQDPALAAEVSELANSLGLHIDHLLRNFASHTVIEDQDYAAAKAEPAKRRYEQGGYRQTLQYDPDMAAAWCKMMNPLGDITEAVTMRPVALKAFERAARSQIAVVKNQK